MPDHVDHVVLWLRSRILLDEKDLSGPAPPRVCSSLDDGPFCAPLELFLAESHRGARAHGPLSHDVSSSGLFGLGEREVARIVADGVLPQRWKAQHAEAFDWGADTKANFLHIVRYFVETEMPTKKMLQSSARGSVQCFRLALGALPPHASVVPADFSAGLPASIAASWSGEWRVDAEPRSAEIPWTTRLELRTGVGSVSFPHPVVAQHVLIGVPVAARCDADGACWGAGALVCGRLKGKERWCAALGELAARLAADEEGSSAETLRYVDVGNSLLAVDRIVVIASPSDAVRLALIEVSVTLPSRLGVRERRGGEDWVLLLTRPPHAASAPHVEPMLVTVSPDAAVWDLNEVLQQHMVVRPPPAAAAAAAAASAVSAAAVTVAAALTAGAQGHAGLVSAATHAARAAHGKRRGDRETHLSVQKEGLMHNTVEALLQDQIREQGLDGLLALQAFFQHLPERTSLLASFRSPGAAGRSDDDDDVDDDDVNNDGAAAPVVPEEEYEEGGEALWAALLARHAALGRKMARALQQQKQQQRASTSAKNVVTDLAHKILAGPAGGDLNEQMLKIMNSLTAGGQDVEVRVVMLDPRDVQGSGFALAEEDADDEGRFEYR
eukprot:NODE_2841_length_2134_cov_10.116094.p1 GENE.NODE_2841_length_2134_cov_10.116094~~NODE_2841_length_2134_cov_10.116094.p1  ORF type:complete len:620 (-),score=204.71 NODE_2841_length_2134_cov_10.116094:274-2109(-)